MTAGETAAGARLHHIVFAVHPLALAEAARMFTELGFVFSDFELDDLGLRVLLDWDRGIELVSPMPGETGDGSAVAEFLASRGPGVFSVVIRVPDAPDAEELAKRYGAEIRYRQHREGEGYALDEVELSVRGLPLTFLSTDLP
ncbi:VOC family protein [Nocardia bovistercoris]|uniref:VOC domain-containing protein n=1 Tax=Nocardia bovistercoris TaxID=2785916 RepID=A0A931N313_9NOCA|nr:hypothetical protein [Nocardia bovistercoris]MBH0776631.1 hypothetical protein [Nocardia bovistercoris]